MPIQCTGTYNSIALTDQILFTTHYLHYLSTKAPSLGLCNDKLLALNQHLKLVMYTEPLILQVKPYKTHYPITIYLIYQLRLFKFSSKYRYVVKNMDKWGYNYLIE